MRRRKKSKFLPITTEDCLSISIKLLHQFESAYIHLTFLSIFVDIGATSSVDGRRNRRRRVASRRVVFGCDTDHRSCDGDGDGVRPHRTRAAITASAHVDVYIPRREIRNRTPPMCRCCFRIYIYGRRNVSRLVTKQTYQAPT